MSTLITSELTTRARPGHDTRRFRRWAAAVLLPLGPLSVAILRGILPYYTADDTPTIIRRVTAQPGREMAVLWLVVVGLATLIPSVLAAGRLASRRAPVLALIGVGLLVPAFAALFFASGDQVLPALTDGTVNQATAVRLYDAMNAEGPLSQALGFFVSAHIIGFVVLGFALWRSRVVPAWAGVAVVASQPLHVFFAIVVPNHPLDACSWGLAALGFAAAAVRVLHTDDDSWDLPPLARAARSSR
jgi:hypothetical protein